MDPPIAHAADVTYEHYDIRYLTQAMCDPRNLFCSVKVTIFHLVKISSFFLSNGKPQQLLLTWKPLDCYQRYGSLRHWYWWYICIGGMKTHLYPSNFTLLICLVLTTNCCLGTKLRPFKTISFLKKFQKFSKFAWWPDIVAFNYFVKLKENKKKPQNY